MAIKNAATPVFSRMPDILMKSLCLDCASPLKVGFGGTGAPAFFRAASKKLTCFASSSIISLNAFLIVSGPTVERVPVAELVVIVAIGVLLLEVGSPSYRSLCEPLRHVFVERSSQRHPRARRPDNSGRVESHKTATSPLGSGMNARRSSAGSQTECLRTRSKSPHVRREPLVLGLARVHR